MTRELKSTYLKIIDLLHSDSGDVSCDVSAGAQTITSCVCAYTEQGLLDMTKLTGVGTDGAATTMGSHTGVVTQVQTITPSAIRVHCTAHRLDLASTQAVKYVKWFKNILHQLFELLTIVLFAGED